MKSSAIITCIMLHVFSWAQKTEMYYDYNWKPCAAEDARFYSTVEKTDSGWLRHDYYISSMKLQMRAIYQDRDCKTAHGPCFYFHANGNPSAIGRKMNNKPEGVYVRYHSNGMMSDSAYYQNGIPVGSRLLWYRNGYMSDSIDHVNDSMDIHISWFDDGSVSFAGYTLHGKKHGKWQFFHRNGKLAGAETYKKGEVVSKEYYQEDGTPQPDTAKSNKPASFKNGGLQGWKKYLEKNLYWPTGYHFSNGNMAVVMIEMTINEQGKPEDVEVVIPFHPEFDNIALKIIRNSPAWLPEISNNRRVKSRFRQPVTFQQEE